jgi:integrator complex subunit 11
VIVTHFHLDHCGALPYFTEVHGYHGPVIMTYPTKALIPLMLEDFRKVLVDRLGDHEYYTSAHIKQCMRKVIAVDLMQTYKVRVSCVPWRVNCCGPWRVNCGPSE